MSDATKADLIAPEGLKTRLDGLPGWLLDRELAAIERQFVFEDFQSAFRFMTRIADEAEQVNHHPEWCNVWNRVDIRLTTHSAGGLTEKDFCLAERINEIAHHFALQCGIEDAERCGGCV